MKVKHLNELATEMVGDNGTPNTFFVSVKGNVVLIATDFAQAYGYWQSLATTHTESMLEDRLTGVVCESGPHYDENDKAIPDSWQIIDDTKTFGFRS